jgi:hypothetical protein
MSNAAILGTIANPAALFFTPVRADSHPSEIDVYKSAYGSRIDELFSKPRGTGDVPAEVRIPQFRARSTQGTLQREKDCLREAIMEVERERVWHWDLPFLGSQTACTVWKYSHTNVFPREL